MGEGQKKTLGIAVASLVFGCLLLIPVLGIVFSFLAIILGIIALAKVSNDKENLKGKKLAIPGIILGGVGVILFPVIVMLAAIAVPNFLKARINANENHAKATLKAIAVASESYAEDKGEYPFSIHGLIPLYLNEDYTFGTSYGYKINCDFSYSGYRCKAVPEKCGTTGERVYVVITGAEFSERDCF